MSIRSKQAALTVLKAHRQFVVDRQQDRMTIAEAHKRSHIRRKCVLPRLAARDAEVELSWLDFLIGMTEGELEREIEWEQWRSVRDSEGDSDGS